MSFGSTLKELRKKHQLTQEELAKQLSVKKHCLSDWEIERSDPNIESLKAIADCFGLSIQNLLEMPLLIQPLISFDKQQRYIKLEPQNSLEEQLFLKLEGYNSEQLHHVKYLIQMIKEF